LSAHEPEKPWCSVALESSHILCCDEIEKQTQFHPAVITGEACCSVTTALKQPPIKPAHTKVGPRYFHLLWDDDLKELRELLQAVLNRRTEVVQHWNQLYSLHFGGSRSLSDSEFVQIFEPAIERGMSALLEGDMESYTSHMFLLGESLVERGVPIDEVIASLHLFEESAHAVFPQDPPPPTPLYTAFDKLSHVRLILLVSAYFRLNHTASTQRVAALERDAARLPPSNRSHFHGLVGEDAAMRELYRRIDAVAPTRGNLLIVGESGTGKELVARAVHESGPRGNRPFIAFNCAAIPKDLIESELFGYKRGAFSGANSEYLGLFRAADGGTLFLDEVTEMSPETQSKLLRAIQERTVRPVGSTSEQPVDVRLIASTNRVPREAMAEGRLRRDLYYRLQGSVLTVPPLRERASDIPLLVEHFIAIFNARLGRNVKGIDRPALLPMSSHSWPGNVRELSNAIESALTFSTADLIGLADLPGAIRMHSCRSEPEAPASYPQPESQAGPVSTFAEAERELVERALQRTGGNKRQAAKLLQISRKTLYAKIKQHDL
jgi:DNA-binding NtrC family response regulator